jgi:uncharacterized cupredoxin-like copper-binding protein
MKRLTSALFTVMLLSGLAACGKTSANQDASTSSPSPSSMSSMAASPSASTSPAAEASASPNPSASTATQGATVNAVETEMAIALSNTTLSAGPTTFVVENKGKEPHELVIFKTDLALNQLPLKDGKLDEDSKSLENIADTGEETLKAGETKTLQANLTPGHYVVICNVENHFRRGMKTEFTVQ